VFRDGAFDIASPGHRRCRQTDLIRAQQSPSRLESTDDTRQFFTASVEANLDALYSVALRLTRHAADAEDLVADCVSRAWSALDTLANRARFRPWIFRILRNTFISDRRRRAVRPTEVGYADLLDSAGDDDLASLLIDQPDDFLDWWADPELEVANVRLGESILAAIDELPEAFRTTIVLVTVEGLGYDEAAEVLGVPPGTVRSRMKRGRTLLQKALWTQGRDAGLITSETRERSLT
jgi:RNA polymerase sigma-70 factor (ECF subfamily)